MGTDSDELILKGADLGVTIPQCSMGQLMFMKLRSQPHDNVLKVESESGRRVTSSQFLGLSMQAAEGLKALGVEQGDVVALVGKNGIDISAATVATLFIAAVACPIDPSMKNFEFQHMFRTVEPKFAFCDAEAVDEVSKALDLLENSCPIVLLCADPDVEYSFTKFEDFLKEPDDGFQPTPVEDNTQDVCFILCSSGTTGLPKGVMLPHSSLIYQLLAAKHFGNGALTNFLHTSHFFWVTGILMFCGYVCNGSMRVIVRNLNEVNILNAIQDYKPNWCLLAPAHLSGLLNHPDFSSYDVSSMQLIATGGSALPKSTLAKLSTLWMPDVRVMQGYGMSEVGGMISSVQPDGDIASVGIPAPGTQIKIAGPDERALGPGEEGEVYVKSLGMMKGYINNEIATKETIDEDGWVHSGDIGYYTEDGQLYISGRIKEFIKYQNLQIAPAEIEALIHTVPGVKDVAVAGVNIDPDTYYPMAMVVKEDDVDVTEEDVVKIVNENMSDYKHLRGGVVFVDEIPRTMTGKIKRRDLQLLAKALYLDDPMLGSSGYF